jgi:hypothetical protein
MHHHIAKHSFDTVRLAVRSHILAAGVQTRDGWSWSDGAHSSGQYAALVAGLVDALRAKGESEAEVELARVCIVIDSALVGDEVEYGVAVYEVGGPALKSVGIRKGLRRAMRSSWGIARPAERPRPPKPKGPAKVTPRRAVVDMTYEEILEEAERTGKYVRVLWHPHARKASRVMGDGWRTTEGIPARSATPGKWYLQREDRTSHTFHVGSPRVGEPSVLSVEIAEVLRGR